MGIQHYLILVGAFLIVPLYYDLFKGRDALKRALKNKLQAIELIVLSVMTVEVVWILIKIYLMIKQLPLSTKY